MVQLEDFVSLNQELCSWKVLCASRVMQLEDFVSLRSDAVGRFCKPQEWCSWKIL